MVRRSWPCEQPAWRRVWRPRERSPKSRDDDDPRANSGSSAGSASAFSVELLKRWPQGTSTKKSGETKTNGSPCQSASRFVPSRNLEFPDEADAVQVRLHMPRGLIRLLF